MKTATLAVALASLLGPVTAFASPYLRSGKQLPLHPLRVAQAATLGDFDADGRLDAAYGLSLGTGVAVLLGDGAGGFGRPVVTSPNLGSSSGTVALTTADFNRDGRLDLAFADLTNAIVFLGLGDGRFTTSVLGGTDLLIGGLDVGDFDGDGRADVAVARRPLAGTSQVLVFRGNGAGGFASPVSWNVPALQYPRGVVAADLDGDGDDDLAVADEFGDAVGVLLGSPGLALALRGPFPAGDQAVDVDAGDVDGDGRLDLVAANQTAAAFSVLLADAAGGFGAPRSFAGPTQSAFVALVDLDADGRLDVAETGSNLWLRRGDGHGGFGAPRRYGIGGTLSSGRVDGDAHLDLLVGDSLLSGDGAGGVDAQRAHPAGPRPRFAVADDFDHDGHQDVAVATEGGAVSLLRGDGHGGFGPPAGALHGSAPVDLVRADFDRDGWSDLAVAYADNQDVVVLRNDRQGGFEAHVYPIGGTPGPIAVGDLGGDGPPDILVANRTTRTLVALHGAGDGTFGPGGSTALGEDVASLALGHFNADVRLDAAVASARTGVVAVLPGTGLETFVTGGVTEVALRAAPRSLLAHDLDGDGNADLAASGSPQALPALESLGLLAGNGAGGFVQGPVQPPALLWLLQPVDVTGDGRLDLAALDFQDGYPDALHLLERSPGGLYRSPDGAGVPVGGRANALFVADFDEDGIPDLGAAVESADAVTILPGRAPSATAADLAVVIEDTPDPAAAGQPVHYRVTVRNLGPAAAVGTRLRFTLSPVTPHLGSTPGAPVCSRLGQLLACDLPTLAPAASFDLDVDVGTTGLNGGTLTAWAEVAATAPADLAQGDNFAVASTRLSPVDLALTLSDSVDPVLPGQTFLYRLRVANRGEADATAVTVRAELPASLTLAGLGAGCLVLDRTVVQCAVATLPAGQAVDFEVQVLATDTFTSTALEATADALEIDVDLGNNTAREETSMTLGLAGELTHGSLRRGSLPPGDPAEQMFAVQVPPRASYEVVLDEASGDYGSGSNHAVLERLAADTTGVLQVGQPAGTGAARVLRWSNTTAAPQRHLVRVRSRGCGTDCGPDDGYRLRAYETTAALARFNTTGGQTTVVLVQNRGSGSVSATLWFTGVDGQLAGSRSFSLAPRAVFVLNVATLLPGRSGAVTLTHDAGYGGLAAKAIAIEPANGTSYDTVLQYRSR
ncbi:MAG: FG-GAP-like repeat-containing protein [Vicinamibacteria bacterium]